MRKSCLNKAHALAAAAFMAAAGGTDIASSADIAVGSPVKAPPPATLASGWEYRFTPYAWITGLYGTQTIRGRTVEVDASFIDIVEKSDSIVALMGYFEARNGPFSLFTDLVYSKLTASGSASRSREFTPHVSGTLGASLGVDYEMLTWTFGAAYEMTRWDAGSTAVAPGVPASFTAVDIMAGGRYWRQKADVSLDVTGTVDLGGLTIVGNRAIARSGSVDWLDPFIGVRLRHQISPGKELTLAGDVGGFGVGSKFSWQLVGAYSWEFHVSQNVTWSAVIGYRALYVDYAQGSGLTRYEYDMLQHGPILGIDLRF